MTIMMKTTAPLITSILYSIIIGLTAAEPPPSCSCSPQSLTLQINLSGTCPPDITNVDTGNGICFISPGGTDDSSSSGLDILEAGGAAGGSDFQPPSDPIPTAITSITYHELSESLEVINQETIEVTAGGASVDEVTFTSITANLDPNEVLSEQSQYIVSSAWLVIEGTNAGGKSLRNTVTWKYDLQQCNTVPMAIGNTLGWVDVIDLKLAKPEFCPAVPETFVKQETTTTSSTEATTTEMTTTTNATNGGWGSDGWNNNKPNNNHTAGGSWIWVPDPTHKPTTQPPVYPTYSPTEVETKEPSKSPTLQPVYPTYSPTAATDGSTNNTHSKPTLSGHSSGWNSDGWTPPETHLLGGNTTTTTPATEASNETESSSTTVSDASTTESSSSTTPADMNATEEVVTTTTIATTTTTSSTEEETTSTSTEATTIAASTTTEATRPPKTTTTEATRAPKNALDLSQEINYLGTIENGGNIMTCSSNWLTSSSVVAAVAMGAILLV